MSKPIPPPSPKKNYPKLTSSLTWLVESSRAARLARKHCCGDTNPMPTKAKERLIGSRLGTPVERIYILKTLVLLAVPLTLILSVTRSCLANAVWQSLFFESEALAHIWWVIPVGLLIECPVVRKVTSFTWGKRLLVTVVVNFLSFIFGMAPQSIFLRPGLIGIVLLFVAAILWSSFVESYFINRFRKRSVNRQNFPLVLLVNAISGSLTLAVVLFYLS